MTRVLRRSVAVAAAASLVMLSVSSCGDLDEESEEASVVLPLDSGEWTPAGGGDALTELIGAGPTEERQPSRTFPISMYLLGRYLEGKPVESAGDAAFVAAFDDWHGDPEFLASIFEAYRDLTEEEYTYYYDEDALDLAADLDRVLEEGELAALFGASEMWSDFDPPQPPSGLTAVNAFQLPNPDKIGSERYQIELTWTDESGDEDGFAVYRRSPDGPPQQVTTLGPNVTTYLDPLTQPANDADQLCYQVAAFRSVPGPGGQSLVAESELNATACSTYAWQAPPPPPDFDEDGVPDDLDECRTTHSGWADFKTNGCPDYDGDGVADWKDKCPEPGDMPASQDTSGYLPDEGCPYEFAVRWMRMEVLNNTGQYAFPSYKLLKPDGGEYGLTQNETDTKCETGDGQRGEEPYLVFSFANGINEGGSVNDGTARWCCGELIDVDEGRYEEPDDNTCGEESLAAYQAIAAHGLVVFPAGQHATRPIDEDQGLLLAMTLLERDFVTTVTVEEEADGFAAAMKIGVATGAAAKACLGGGPAGCLGGIGFAIKSAIENIFGLLSTSSTTFEIDDPDDFQGTEVWGIDRVSAKFKTAVDGAYGFWVDIPMEHMKSCLGWQPCLAGQGAPTTMRARLYMCLHREGVPEAKLHDLCAPYEQVLPWPQYP